MESLKHIELRAQLVSSIQRKGIKNKRILQAIGKVPRHLFIDSSFEAYAYNDRPLSIGEGQTISQPFTVAFQTELLNLKPKEKVLEVGTGSGYQSAILLELENKVFTIESNKLLFQRAKKLLYGMEYKNIFFFIGDGSKGLPIHSPFDKIIVTAGSPIVCSPLVEQLKIGGILVIPVGDLVKQSMLKITKISDDKTTTESHGLFHFVKLRGEKGW